MRAHILIQKARDVTHTPDILQALGLHTLFVTRDYTVTDYLTTDIDILARRTRLFWDALEIPGLFALLCETVRRLTDVRELLRLGSTVSESDRGLYALRRLEMYFDIVDDMTAFGERYADKFTSEDLRTMFEDLAETAAGEEYRTLRRHTESVVEEIRRVRSITVGFNLDAALTPYEAGLLAINDRPVESGHIIDRILRLDGLRGDTAGGLLSMVPLLPSRTACTADEYAALTHATYTALSKIFKKQVRRIEPEVQGYLKNHLQWLLDLLPDLHLICDMTEIQKRFSAAGLPLCVPEFRPMEEGRFSAEGLYEPMLALRLQESGGDGRVVANDLSFDEAGGIYLLTGPNSGGKTVFLRSVGVAQLMAQVGMPVPARRLTVSPVRHLYAAFPRASAAERSGGRLEHECGEIRRMFSAMDAHSLVLLDEVFSSTSPDEAITLALEVLKAMSLLGARGICISHYHLLTSRLQELNAAGSGGLRFDFLAAEITDGESRTFRITRRLPDGTSYAGSIAERYGISTARLIGNRPPIAAP